MNLSSDTKFVIGVLLATVIVIGAGAWLTTINSKSQAPRVVPESLRENLVRDDSPTAGPKDAKVTVVEFADFQCPACGALHPVLKKAKEQYKDKSVKFVYRNYPLPQHEHAALAAEAALIAGTQNKFWEFHNELFENQKKLTQADLEVYAKNIGLDGEKFKADLNAHTQKATVGRDITDGNVLGINSTPTVFINNTQYTGKYSVAEFTSAIDAELNK